MTIVRAICLIILLQVILNLSFAATIKSSTIVTKWVNGKQVQVQRLVLQCDSNTGSTPLTLSFNRQGASEADTLRFDCPPPEVDYGVELMGFIPEAVFVTNTPIIYTAPGVNLTSAEDIIDYVTQQITDQLERSGIDIDPADNAARFPFDEAHSRSRRRASGRVWSLSNARVKSSTYANNPFLRAAIESNRKLTRLYHEVHGRQMPSSGGVLRRHEHSLLSSSSSSCPPGQRCLLQAGTSNPGSTPPCTADSTTPCFDPETGDYNGPATPPPSSESGLYSMREIMWREVTQTLVRGIIFSLTASVGGLLTTVVDIAFAASGQSAIGLLAKTLELFISRVLEFQYNVIGFMAATKSFNKVVVQNLKDIVNTLDSLRKASEEHQYSIDLLQNKTERMRTEQDAFRTSVQNQFTNVSNAFNMIGQNQDNITRVILQLIDKGDFQFQLLVNAIKNLRRYVEGVQNQAEGLNSEILERRMISLYYHQTLKELDSLIDKIGPTAPFMNDPGRKPLTFAQKNALRNVAGALVMASVELQGSYRVASSPGSSTKNAFAVGLKIDMICDPDYVANISISEPGPEFIWDSIGPETTAMPQCSGILGTASPWNCQCIFRVTGKRAQYPSSNPSSSVLFPWYLGNSEIGLYYAQINALTSGSLTGSTPIDLAPVYLNTMTEMEAYLESAEICNPSSATNTREWINDRVRVLSQFTVQYADVLLESTLFPTGRAAMCNGYYQEVLSSNPSANATIASIVFTFLRQEFGSFLRVRSETANNLIYGSAGEVKVDTQPGSTNPTRYPAYKQSIVQFASLAVDEYGQAKTLPVFRLKRRGIRYKLNMRYNGGSTVTHSAMNDGNQTDIPSADPLLGNITTVSDTALATITNLDLLDPTMPWIGHSVHHTNNPAYFDALSEEETDPSMPTLHTDFKLTDIVFNGPREDAMNYIWNEKRFFDNQPIKETYDLGSQMIMNISTWRMQATPGSNWDPLRATNTAAQKLRRIPPGTSFCEQSYSVFDAALTTARPNNDMCDIREAFEAPVYWPLDTSEVTFVPRDKYVFEHVVEVPLGTLTEIVTTKCPSSYNVTYYPSTQLAMIVLRSDSEAISAKYSICKSDGITCLVSGTTISMSPGIPFSRTVTGVDQIYFMQVWPSTDSAPTGSTKCFADLGVMMFINSSFSNSGALPGNVLSQVREAVAPTLESLFSNQVAQLALTQTIFEILLSAKSGDELKNLVLANLATIQNITGSLQDSIFAENQAMYERSIEAQKYYANISVLLDVSRDKALAQLANAANLIAKVNSTFPYLDTLLILQDYYFNGSLDAYNRLREDFVRYQEKLDLDLSSLNPLTLAGKIGKAIGGIFSGGFGLGGLFDIIQFLMTIAFIGAIIYFAPKILAFCRNRGGNGSNVLDPGTAAAFATMAQRLSEVEIKYAQDHAELEILRTNVAEMQAVSRSAPVPPPPTPVVTTRTAPTNGLTRRNTPAYTLLTEGEDY